MNQLLLTVSMTLTTITMGSELHQLPTLVDTAPAKEETVGVLAVTRTTTEDDTPQAPAGPVIFCTPYPKCKGYSSEVPRP